MVACSPALACSIVDHTCYSWGEGEGEREGQGERRREGERERGRERERHFALLL